MFHNRQQSSNEADLQLHKWNKLHKHKHNNLRHNKNKRINNVK